VGIQVSQSFLVDVVDSLELFGPNFELDAGLDQIAVKLSLEVSAVDHQLLVFPSFLPETAL
jgi:hypothetical protein